MDEKNSTIYAIRNNRNGKVYIGSTTNPNQRLTRHLSALNHNSHPNSAMQQDFNENDGDFSVAMLFNGDYAEAISLIERLYMTLFQTRDEENGYNSEDPSVDISLSNVSFKPLSQRIKQIYKHGDTFREWLYNARIESGLTQLEVAKKLGISEAYYSYVENGTRQKRMDVSFVSKISKLFNIPVGQIIKFEEREE